MSFNWNKSVVLGEIAEICEEQVYAHGDLRKTQIAAGVTFKCLAPAEFAEVENEFEFNAGLAALGDSLQLVGEWCKRSQTAESKGSTPIAINDAFGAVEQLKKNLAAVNPESKYFVKFTGTPDNFAEILSKKFESASEFLSQLVAHLKNDYGATLPEFKTKSSRSGLGSPEQIVEAMIAQSDARANMLAARSMKNFVNDINREAARKGFK